MTKKTPDGPGTRYQIGPVEYCFKKERTFQKNVLMAILNIINKIQHKTYRMMNEMNNPF